MKYHCDLLLPKGERYISPKFRALRGSFDPYKVEPAYLIELMILMWTPGFDSKHVATAFRWNQKFAEKMGELRSEYAHRADDGMANAVSMEVGDGLAFLRAMLDGRPKFVGSVPLWVSRDLMDLRKRGQSCLKIGQILGVSGDRVRTWSRGGWFDPLSGKLLESNHFVSKSAVGLVL